MTRHVFCHKLQQNAEGLERPPLPGALGTRIFEHISKAAWSSWTQHQTMLINEYRLNLMDKEARTFLQSEMERFLFGEGSEVPPGFTPKTQG
ncbi:protein that protects iron-sulfur proteins against oxidative damage [Legionella geestiana]|uniref:Probable Fe(2+)-trafficking protein n=1 Tax=Legionella geestiana TaxID=45065 RepID=A0A0W0U5R3_9GAMM|nr:oxidative damage protection protein [Legionella geestiana]KTD02873.1 protein that protects iron-sulfur proteins against oxidative damage [Legionella geestiana]QBS11690.1 oxidative damage protection protein [Legionella geestiana]QDQ40699.1 oxidative damage protection protein [Legionella geestiana]STX53623.1 protein that protects iron-sulfur proteins against oxidative damage [Legionella geestiana]